MIDLHAGWFKFYRQIFDNPICTKDSEYFFVWCYILTEVKYEEERALFKNEEIVLKKGQLLTTTKEIASRLNICESKVNRILKKLEIEKQIEKQTSNKNTLITVLNWDKYQSDEKQNEEQVKNKWKTNEEQMTNERQTSEEQVKNKWKTSGEPSYYNKELKKERNKELNNNIICSEPKKASEPPVIELILNNKSLHPIYQEDVDHWKELYPAVDIIQELRNMKGWCESNPTKRKTSRGINRFITSWLSNEQNKPHTQRKEVTTYESESTAQLW